MDEIGKFLPTLFRKQIARAEPHLLEILIPLWPRISGKFIADHSQPASFASGVLTLNTDSATWSTQLRQMTDEIRGGINGFLGKPIVKKLRIRTVTYPELFSTPRSTPRLPPAASLRPDKPMHMDSIADPEIAATIENSFVKYFNRPGRS